MNKVASPAIRILSLDGGGIRGAFSVQFLMQFCEKANIDPKRIFDSFDLIIGTSIGGLQAVAYADGKSPKELLEFFYAKGEVIFPDRGWVPGYQARVVMGLSTDSTFYAQEPLKNAMLSMFGEDFPLEELNCKVALMGWNSTDNEPVIFSNIKGMKPLVQSTTAMNAALATSAAPLYFPPAEFNNKKYLDGGVIQNNPSLMGMMLSKHLFPRTPNVHILSVGTCMGWPQEGGVLPDKVTKGEGKYIKDENGTEIFDVPDNVRLMFYLMGDVFMSGVQKLNDRMLQMHAQTMGYKLNYLRFQYQFPEGQDAPMDDGTKTYIDKLVNLAKTEFTAKEDDIDLFIKKFGA